MQRIEKRDQRQCTLFLCIKKKRITIADAERLGQNRYREGKNWNEGGKM